MIINLYIASDWVGIRFKKYCEVFPRPLDHNLILGRLKEQRCSARVRAVCVVHSRSTVIRIAPFYGEKVTTKWIYQHFPYGEKFNDSTHIFSFEVFKSSILFMAALPIPVLDDVCAVCEGLRIPIINITQADIIERRLFMEYINTNDQCWVCFPMADGIRILALSGGLPKNSHFISNDPSYRIIELKQLVLPNEAVIFNGCDWLFSSLSEAHVKIIKGGAIFAEI